MRKQSVKLRQKNKTKGTTDIPNYQAKINKQKLMYVVFKQTRLEYNVQEQTSELQN